MTAADLVLYLLIGAAVAGLAAFIALPFIYIRGLRQMDRALEQVFSDRDRRASVDNVRSLAKWETARRMERKSR